MAAEEQKETKEQNKTKKEKKPLDLSKGGLIWTIWHLVEAALLIVGGILAIVYSSNPDVQKVIYPVVGGFMIFGGALKIISNFLPIVATSSFEAEAKLKAKKPWPTIWLSVAALNWPLASPFAW